MCRASRVGAEIHAHQLPVIGQEVFDLISKDCIPGGSRENLKTANDFTNWDSATDTQKYLLTDAQTSGGLLLAVSARRLNDVLKLLKQHRTTSAKVIGLIVRSKKPKIWIKP